MGNLGMRVNLDVRCTLDTRSMFVRTPDKLSLENTGTFGGRSNSTAWPLLPARCSFGFTFGPDGFVKGVHGTERNR
jgi:hypothetical protein